MKLFSFFIPGPFEDALVYKGHLILITDEASLMKIRLDKIVEAAELIHPECGPLFQYMFLRNDWLASQQFKTLMRSQDVRDGFRALIDIAPREMVRIERSRLLEEERSLNMRANSVLDFLIYNDRLYLGTDKGLFDATVEVNSENFVTKLRVRHEAPCLSATARYGTINASCGSEGLFTAFEDFTSNTNNAVGDTLKRKGVRSVRTSWFDHNIMNYPVNRAPTFIRTEYKKPPKMERTESILTEISNEENDLSALFGSLKEEYGVEEDSVQFSYNFVHNLFMQTFTGDFFGATLQRQDRTNVDAGKKDDPLQARGFKKYKELNTPILSVDTSSAGQVIETERSVLLFTQDDFYPLVHQPVFSVRTFGQSKYYKNLIVLAQADGVRIVSAFDDLKYLGVPDARYEEDFSGLELPDAHGM